MTTAEAGMADPAASALTLADRARVGWLWAKRAQNELATSSVFAQLHQTLVEHGAAVEVLRLSARAVADELRHFEMCVRIAERYGVLEPAPRVPPPAAPSFAACAVRRERLFFATMQCCVNETIAASYLQTCLAEATDAAVHDVVRDILRDEIGHSRIGWAVLSDPSLTAAERRAVADFMPDALQAYAASWLSEPHEHPEDLPRGHGCLRHSAIQRAVREAVTGVILQGLDHVEIESRPARAWASRSGALLDS
jgi:hypothetical protein